MVKKLTISLKKSANGYPMYVRLLLIESGVESIIPSKLKEILVDI